jgi:hypothetical protein
MENAPSVRAITREEDERLVSGQKAFYVGLIAAGRARIVEVAQAQPTKPLATTIFFVSTFPNDHIRIVSSAHLNHWRFQISGEF